MTISTYSKARAPTARQCLAVLSMGAAFPSLIMDFFVLPFLPQLDVPFFGFEEMLVGLKPRNLLEIDLETNYEDSKKEEETKEIIIQEG